jgi:hypothetical protein
VIQERRVEKIQNEQQRVEKIHTENTPVIPERTVEKIHTDTHQ